MITLSIHPKEIDSNLMNAFCVHLIVVNTVFHNTLKPVINEQITKWLTIKTVMKYVLSAFFNNALLLVTTKNKHRETVSRRVSLDARLLNKILPPRYSFEVPQAISIPEKVRRYSVYSISSMHIIVSRSVLQMHTS